MLILRSVWGSADTKYIQEKDDDREKRRAIGTYEKSGLSQYTQRKEGVNYGTPESFPMNWEPRYAIAAGVGKCNLSPSLPRRSVIDTLQVLPPTASRTTRSTRTVPVRPLLN